MFSFFGNNDDDDNQNNNNLRPPRRLARMGAYNYEDRADINDGLGDDNRIDLDNGAQKISVQAASDANRPWVDLTGVTTSSDGEESRSAKAINIKSLNGNVTPIFMNTFLTVLNLKQKYVRKVDVALDDMRLIFKGHQLDDNKTLDHYRIKPGNTIHLIMRLRGGILGGGKKKKRKSKYNKRMARKSKRRTRRKSKKRGAGCEYKKVDGKWKNVCTGTKKNFKINPTTVRHSDHMYQARKHMKSMNKPKRRASMPAKLSDITKYQPVPSGCPPCKCDGVKMSDYKNLQKMNKYLIDKYMKGGKRRRKSRRKSRRKKRRSRKRRR